MLAVVVVVVVVAVVLADVVALIVVVVLVVVVAGDVIGSRPPFSFTPDGVTWFHHFLKLGN